MEATVTVLPIVNNNGTSKEDLLFNYRVVMGYAKKAVEEACAARPHGRDYQTHSDPDAATKARDEYEAHVVQPLAQATAYLEKLLIHISDQK